MLVDIENIRRYKSVSDLRLSPNGTKYAFLSHRVSPDLLAYETYLHVQSTVSENKDFASIDNVGSYIWLNDEEILVAVIEGDMTVVKKLGEDGTVQIVQKFPQRVVLEDKLTQELVLLSMNRRITKPSPSNNYTVVDEYPFWYDGRGYISGIRKQLFAWIVGGEPVLITPEKLDVHQFDTNNEGKVIAAGPEYSECISNTDSIYYYDCSRNEGHYLSKSDEYRVSQLAIYKEFAVVCATDVKESYYASPKFTLFELTSNEKKIIADPGLSIGNSTITDVRHGRSKMFDADSSGVYFIATVDYGSQLFHCTFDGIIRCLSSGLGSIDTFTISAEHILVAGMRDMQLQEVYYLENRKEIRISNVNKGGKFPEPKYLCIKNTNGDDVCGMVRQPRGNNIQSKYPGILCIHGGPNGTYSSVFHHEMQMLADRGNYVFCCNPTGSDGKKNGFGDVSGRWGTIDYDDIMLFMDAVLLQYPEIDQSRLIVFGGSYGGFMTNWIIGHTNRFCAAISDRSISNSPSKDVTGDNGGQYGPMHLHSNVYDDPGLMWEKSPLKYASSARTPTLFIHGIEDYRCHISQAYMMFTALKMNNIPAKLIGFKHENHDLCRTGQPKRRIRRLEEIVKWIEQWTSEAV